jgi:Flp pilus assembly protein CpaB
MELVQKLTSTRAGTMTLAALAALLAGISILVYLSKYRSSVSAAGAPVTVLVAKRLIPQGTQGAAIAASGLFTTRTIRESQLRNGALSDPVSLHGRAAAHEIYPGQQLTATDFVAGANSAAASLTKSERLISIPLDSAHGIIGQVQAGDHVDVFVGFNVIPISANGVPTAGGSGHPVLKLVMQNIPVVEVDTKLGSVGGGSTTNVTLRATPAQAENLAFASDNGKIWLVLRPAAGAKVAKPGIVTVETMLLGIPPITIVHYLKGKH